MAQGWGAYLAAWTPELAVGFAVNLGITGAALALGSALGVGLGRLQGARAHVPRLAGAGAVALLRNVPSFVLLFYVALVVPPEIAIGDTVWPLPDSLKAVVALTFPVAGFVADQELGFGRRVAAGEAGARRVFWTAWVNYALIVLMASATASVIGVDEIVGRADAAIASRGGSTALLMVYGYCALWFLAAAALVKFGVLRLIQRLG